MDAQQFLAEFGHIANAPGGVDHLRELILHLAISGDLIATESPIDASPLLETIEQQKRDHTEKKRVIPKQASVSREIVKAPAHWAVCRLGDLALTITGGGTPSKNHPAYWGGDIPWASVKDMKELKFLDDTEDFITEEGLKNSSSNLIPPGRIIVCTRMGLGKIAVNRVALAINQDLKALELPKEVDSNFFLIIYKTREVSGTGTTVSGIKQDQLLALPAALPPIEEQSRIVAKVDELMALCDRLEQQQQQRRKLQNALRQSTLQAVATATSPHELQTTWTRLADNFGQLSSAPEDVVSFKGMILDLAMSGHLSNIAHRHASKGDELLDAIAARRIAWSMESLDQERKEALAMLKKIRIQQASTPDLALPEHWVWSSLLQVSKVIIDCDHKTPSYSTTGFHLIRTTDIRDGEMRLHSTKMVSQESYLARSRRLVPKSGDIFFTREAPMGEAAIVPNGSPVCLGQRLMLVRLFEYLFNNRFLIYAIRSPSFQNRLQSSAIGMTVKHINVGDVENLMVPVPPRIEQDRIVAIVDGLFHLCDHYMDQLTRKQRMATNLVSSAVSTITGITTEPDEEPMKAPSTELIAPIRLGETPDIKAQAPLAKLLTRHNGEMSAKDLWQRYGGEIDAFYAQLKTEVAHGWIQEPEVAEMRQVTAERAEA
ncbi:restriction endonuclease subunit S [Methylicorpusculum sp.]|uniref:restriction endonuclease subunit S n=1 Tax=Methylicorpusculum sp. TaxID=2713644 RepID=UPI002AB8D193|nr:restriction endonuclease subunit S [Methylicorpusculum sp.]MDZ4153714.1 restriction endonuclease subunit S [Methylicorpusculum sp.]